MIFHQLFEPESSTYTYLLADEKSKAAILIDPVLETVDRDLKLIDELGLRLAYVLDTHIHADHVTAAGTIRERLGQIGQSVKTGVSVRAGVECSDIPLNDGQELSFGRYTLKVLETPGHTSSCLSFYLPSEGVVFTGDALLVRGTGRTDFQEGSSDQLYESVTKRLFALPPTTRVYPAHDYRGHTVTTIGAEMKHNPRLGAGRSVEEFRKIMSELKLSHPKKIDEALPANMSCGRTSVSASKKGESMFKPHLENGIPEITAEELNAAMKAADWSKNGVHLIDVRRPEEYTGEFGHIPGARLVTLGPDLQGFIDAGNPKDQIVFICRSGGRSGQATAYAQQKGYAQVFNMQGGMIRWTELKFSAEKT